MPTTDPPRWRVHYLRRLDAVDVTVEPQFSDSIATGWGSAQTAPTVQPIDSQWEKVVVDDAGGQMRRYGRVQLLYTP